MIEWLVREEQNSLRRFGIPQKYINLLRMCNNNIICKIRISKKITQPFKFTSELRKRNTLSPGLFNLVFEIVMEIMEKARFTELNRNPMLAIADDIAILGDTQEEEIEITKKLIQTGENMELIVSEEKPKHMRVSRETNNNNNNIKIGQRTFERVDSFKYLGTIINSKNDMCQKIQQRINIANRAYFSIVILFKS